MEIFFIKKDKLNIMKGKKGSYDFSKKESHTKPKINQFDHFWEIECPECGSKIDLEVLVNLFIKKKGGRI